MKRISLIATLLLSAGLLWSFDLGVNLNNISGVIGRPATTELIYAQRDTATLWFTQTGEDYSLVLEGFYQFKGDFSPSRTIMLPLRLDLGDFYFQYQFKDLFDVRGLTTIRLGRFDVSDSSARVFNGKTDGVNVRYNIDTNQFSLIGAFTGLSSRQDIRIIQTEADIADYESLNQTSYFAPPKILILAKAKFMEFIDRHDLSLDLAAQVDLRQSGGLNSFYGELLVDGRPLQWFKWQAYLVGQLKSDTFEYPALAAGGRFLFTAPSLANLIATLSMDWASGVGGKFRRFDAINQSPVGAIYSAPFSDLFAPSVRASLSPVSGLNLSTEWYGFFKASGQAPMDKNYPATGTQPYLGTEGSLVVSWAPTSELNGKLRGGTFIPNSAPDAYGAAFTPVPFASLELEVKL